MILADTTHWIVLVWDSADLRWNLHAEYPSRREAKVGMDTTPPYSMAWFGYVTSARLGQLRVPRVSAATS